MQNTVIDRVAEAINESSYKKGDIAKKMDVSYHTIHRWSKKKKKEGFKESEVKALSEALNVNFNWLMHGNERLNEIESSLNELGEDYKGLDRTLSDVESKAKNLIRDLQSLVDDLDFLKGNGG